MSGAAKVSIIVPVYNVKEYLPRCLESCIQQTLYDIEIICVDDGSTDESGKILDTYEKLDARIHIIHKLMVDCRRHVMLGIMRQQGSGLCILTLTIFWKKMPVKEFGLKH